MSDRTTDPSERTTVIPGAPGEAAVSDEALRKAESYIEEEEGAANKLSGGLGWFVLFLAVAMSVFHLYTAYGIV
ncbi:MAG: hypothetical protein EBS65_23085, partial [Betaproteobacteria bacterium]|nr:hypothetical protein [Betaproteobacteria bacterium]